MNNFLIFSFSDRYEANEQTTRKPNTQNNDFYNEFGFGGDQTGPSGDGANVKYVNFSPFLKIYCVIEINEIWKIFIFRDNGLLFAIALEREDYYEFCFCFYSGNKRYNINGFGGYVPQGLGGPVNGPGGGGLGGPGLYPGPTGPGLGQYGGIGPFSGPGLNGGGFGPGLNGAGFGPGYRPGYYPPTGSGGYYPPGGGM